LLLVGDVLVVEDQHGVFVHAGLDLDRLVPGQGFAQIEAGHLAHEMLVKLADRHRHRVSPEVGGRLYRAIFQRSYSRTE